MSALYVTIPIAIFIAILAMVVFILSYKNGQFEDIEGPKYRMLFDDEDEKKN